MIDHDRLFKELLTVFFADFIALFFPDLSAYMDTDSITFLDKEVFTDVTEGEQHEADIVARVRFSTNGGISGVPADAFLLKRFIASSPVPVEGFHKTEVAAKAKSLLVWRNPLPERGRVRA